jgi:rhamnogalacturonyl hydrolase YesR
MNRAAKVFTLLVAWIAIVGAPLYAQKAFSKWPSENSPQEIGKKVSQHFIETPHTNFGRPEPPKQITYPEVATWYGALTFAKLSNDKELTASLLKRFDPLFGTEANLVPNPIHVDNTVFAAVPLEISIHPKEQKYLDMGKTMADKQWANPTPDGLCDQTRFWIDDMFMLIIVQLQAYRATGDSKYLDPGGVGNVYVPGQIAAT